MSWNYRLIRQKIKDGDELVDWIEIYEVHYWVKEGSQDYPNISGWSSSPTTVHGNSLKEIESVLDMMRRAAAKPILDLDMLHQTSTGKPRWVTLAEKIRDFEDLEEGWDGYGGAKPLQRSINQAISVVATAESQTDPLEATLHADGSVILEIGNGSEGSIRFPDGHRIVYACGDLIGSTTFVGRDIPQVLKEVLARAAHRSEPGAHSNPAAPDHSIRE